MIKTNFKIKDIIFKNVDILKDYLLYKGYPEDILPFIDYKSIEYTEDFEIWWGQVYRNYPGWEEFVPEEKKIYCIILSKIIENSLWEDYDSIEKEILKLKYSYKTDLDINWSKIYSDFKSLYLDDLFVLGDVRPYFEKKLISLKREIGLK